MDSRKKIIVLLILLVLAVGIAVLTFWLVKRKSATVAPNQFQTTNPAVEEANKRKAFNQAVDQTYALDKDFDGIPDNEEAKYKTSSTSADTDEDGLLDKDEIFKYQTDPNKADTDGDGYEDGREVRYGHNPRGSGKLK